MQEVWSGLSRWLPLPTTKLIPTIIQDAASSAVLMLVEMDREALELTSATGRIHYYHPHKRKVVAKGEASGHFQEVVEVRLSCGGDQLLIKVRAAGGACEMGYNSCFFRHLTPEGWETADSKVFDPEEVYPEIAFSH
ncbi:MAG: phosphoribosyl-AMP cyclohydrolase [Thermodesulfobacteriota bacterium]